MRVAIGFLVPPGLGILVLSFQIPDDIVEVVLVLLVLLLAVRFSPYPARHAESLLRDIDVLDRQRDEEPRMIRELIQLGPILILLSQGMVVVTALTFML